MPSTPKYSSRSPCGTDLQYFIFKFIIVQHMGGESFHIPLESLMTKQEPILTYTWSIRTDSTHSEQFSSDLISPLW